MFLFLFACTQYIELDVIDTQQRLDLIVTHCVGADPDLLSQGVVYFDFSPLVEESLIPPKRAWDRYQVVGRQGDSWYMIDSRIVDGKFIFGIAPPALEGPLQECILEVYLLE